MDQKNQHGNGGKVAAGFGLAALAAAAAGAIYFYGTDSGKQRRKQLETWSLRMRADVIDKMSKMRDWSEDSYHDLVDAVALRYKNLKHIDKAEIAELASDLKKHWRALKSQVEGSTKTKTPARRRTTRTRTKKTKTQSSTTTE